MKKGISLIVLVITIIVLIILAGVGIMVITGQNGITNKATKAKDDYVIAQEKEQIIIAWNALAIDKASKIIDDIDNEILKNELKNNGNNVRVSNIDDEKLVVKFNNTNNEYVVDKNGNIAFSGENASEENIDDSNAITANSIVNEGNASEYYGKYITNYVAPTINEVNYNNYNPTITNDEEKWQIFYIGDAGNDKNQIYLIASSYIKYEYMPKSKNGNALNKQSDYQGYFNNVLNDYPNGSGEVSERLKYLNSTWFEYIEETGVSQTYVNSKKTAYMLDDTIWSVYANNYADYAIGGPSIELFKKSYEEYYNTELNFYFYETGYVTGTTIQPTYSIYRITDTSQSLGFNMASPNEGGTLGHARTDFLCEMHINGLNAWHNNNGDTVGFRPFICLSSNVKLEADGDNYKIVQ